MKGIRSSAGYLMLSAVLVAFIVGVLIAEEPTKPSLAGDWVSQVKVSEPVVHDNLAVYFLKSDKRDDRTFLTLNEGLKQNLVVVAEKGENGQVNRLVIENKSDHPLFLQEGDRVTGGKQDRTIYSSLVIAPRSGPQEIPTFCVEQSRWQAGETGKNFKGNSNPGYASNAVRRASKLYKNQGVVWDNVAKTKQLLMKIIGTKSATSSLNETQDSEKVVSSTKPFVTKLAKAVEQHEDLVGLAFAVNGKIVEVNIYPGQNLVKRVYPRLLETYALDAIVEAKTDQAGAQRQAPSAKQVLAMLQAPVQKAAARNEKINADNQLEIFAAKETQGESNTRVYQCLTTYQGRLLHLQWLTGPDKLQQQGQTGNQRNIQVRQLNPAQQQLQSTPDSEQNEGR